MATCSQISKLLQDLLDFALSQMVGQHPPSDIRIPFLTFASVCARLQAILKLNYEAKPIVYKNYLGTQKVLEVKARLAVNLIPEERKPPTTHDTQIATDDVGPTPQRYSIDNSPSAAPVATLSHDATLPRMDETPSSLPPAPSVFSDHEENMTTSDDVSTHERNMSTSDDVSYHEGETTTSDDDAGDSVGMVGDGPYPAVALQGFMQLPDPAPPMTPQSFRAMMSRRADTTEDDIGTSQTPLNDVTMSQTSSPDFSRDHNIASPNHVRSGMDQDEESESLPDLDVDDIDAMGDLHFEHRDQQQRFDTVDDSLQERFDTVSDDTLMRLIARRSAASLSRLQSLLYSLLVRAESPAQEATASAPREDDTEGMLPPHLHGNEFADTDADVLTSMGSPDLCGHLHDHLDTMSDDDW